MYLTYKEKTKLSEKYTNNSKKDLIYKITVNYYK